MRKILISGYYGFNNAGDEAILQSILRAMRHAASLEGESLEVTVLSANPEGTRLYNKGIRAVSRTSIPAIIGSIRRCDLFISGGGSLLQDTTGYGLSVIYYLGLVFLAHLFKKPVALYGHGIGPIRKKINRLIARWIIDRIDLVTVRDQESRNELISLGVKKPPLYVTVDPVFYLYPPGKDAAAEDKAGKKEKQPGEKGEKIEETTVGTAEGTRWHSEEKIEKIISEVSPQKPLIGISVREWKEQKKFLEEIARAADLLADRLKAGIIFIPMFPRKDLPVSLEAASMMKHKAYVLDETLTPSEILALFSRIDLLIGVRLHSLIFAAIAGVPMVGVDYDPKIYSFLSNLGLEPAGKVDGLQSQGLFSRCMETWEQRERIKERLEQAVQEFHLEAQNCGEKIFGHFFTTKAKKKKDRIKVLHLISGGDTGGAKTHVLSLINELRKHVDATLVCFMEGEFYQEGREMGMDIRLIPQRRRYELGVIKKLRRLVAEEGFDILHCHGARANFVTAILGKKLALPSITTMHSDYRLDFQGSFYKNLVYTTLNAWSLRSFDYYVAVSDNFREMLISRGFQSERILVIYNGIDFNAPLNLTGREAFFQKFGLKIPLDARIVGIIGRLHPVKGHEIFLEGARLVLDEEPGTHFIIAGDGEEKEKLLALRDKLALRDNVHFTGYVSNPDELMHILDINTLTSYSESFPLVLLEGARLKKPTVSSDVGGIGKLIREGETGLLFSPGDAAGFAAKLLQLLRDEKAAGSFGENLYRHARDNFSLKQLGFEHYNFYRKIVAHCARTGFEERERREGNHENN